MLISCRAGSRSRSAVHQNIRNNVSPSSRSSKVDAVTTGGHLLLRRTAGGRGAAAADVRGKCVAHDNNRDGARAVPAAHAQRHEIGTVKPTIMHDLREARAYLPRPAPIHNGRSADHDRRVVVARQNDVMEMTSAGVPGCGLQLLRRLVPNHMIFIAQRKSDGSTRSELRARSARSAQARGTSREWFGRSAAQSISGGRAATPNIQESAILFALSHVAKNRDLYREHWLKNKRASAKGKTVDQWLGHSAASIAGGTRRMPSTSCGAGARGLARRAYKAGKVEVKAGDYVIKAISRIARSPMYFEVQNYPPATLPYDDTMDLPVHAQRRRPNVPTRHPSSRRRC